MSNSATIKVALTVDDHGAVRRFRNIGDESEKAGRKGRNSFDRMGESAAGFGNRLVSIKSGVASLVAAFAVMEAIEVFNKINEQGMALESTMKRVGAVSRATQEVYEDLEAAARAAGAATEWQASQAGQALQFEAMAGMEAKDAIQGLPDLLDLATAAQEDLGTASDIVTDNLTAFKMHISELPRLNDAFINTTTRSNTTVRMLGESFKYTAPVAAQMGYSVEQTAAFLGIMANSGIKASDAGTDLRQILLRTADAAETLGLSAGATLIDVLEEMYDRQMSANEVTDMFGILASKSAMVLMNNVEAYRQLNQELVDGEGATRALADQVRDSAENDWKVMISAISEAGLKMYDLYEADYRSLIQEITESVNDNAESFETLGHAISGVLSLMEKVVSVGGAAAEKVGHIGELITLNAQAQGMASGGLFSRNLIDGTSFKELKELVQLGEKAMSNDYLERLTAQSELLKIQIDQLEEKLNSSIFYPQGARDQLAAMKADYENIRNAVEQTQSLQKDAETLNRLADAAAALKQINTELKKGKEVLNAAWVKTYESEIIEASQDTISAKEQELERYRSLEGAKPEIVAAAEQEIAGLLAKATQNQLNADQAANREKYAVDIAYAEQIQLDTSILRAQGLQDALEQHEDTQTKITQMEYEEEQKRAEQSKKELEKRLKEEDRLHEKALKIQQRAYESLFDTVQGYVADIVSDWDNAWNTILNIGKRTAAELVATFATQKIVMPVVLSVGSAMGLSWQGTSFEDIAAAQGDGGIGISDLFSAGRSITGLFSTGVTASPVMAATGSGLSAAAAASYAGEFAGVTSAGTSSLLSSVSAAMSAAAPFLAVAGLAIPLIMSFLEDDPDPRVAVFPGRLENSGEYEGEINSPSGYNYHTWLQDVEDRKKLGETITAYLDAKLDAIDAAFDFDLKEVLAGHNFGEIIGDPVNQFDGNFEELLNVMSENMLGGSVALLMHEFLPDTSWEELGETFNLDFLKGLQADGEDLYETFIRLGTVVQGTDDFMVRYHEQVDDFGETSKTAVNNLAIIMTAMEEVDAGIKSITDVSSVAALHNLTDSWNDLIKTLENAHATTEEVATAQAAMATSLGANITGLTADALQAALSQSGDISSVLDSSITGAAYAYIAQSISDSYLSAINATIGQVWIDTGGDVQAVIDAMREIDTTEAQAQILELQESFGLMVNQADSLAEANRIVSQTVNGQLTAAQQFEAWQINNTEALALYTDMTAGTVTREELEGAVEAFSDLGLEGDTLNKVITALADAFVAAADQIAQRISDIEDAQGRLSGESDADPVGALADSLRYFKDIPSLSEIRGDVTTTTKVFDADAYAAAWNAWVPGSGLFDSTAYDINKVAQLNETQYQGRSWTTSDWLDALAEHDLTREEHWQQYGAAEGVNPWYDFAYFGSIESHFEQYGSALGDFLATVSDPAFMSETTTTSPGEFSTSREEVEAAINALLDAPSISEIISNGAVDTGALDQFISTLTSLAPAVIENIFGSGAADALNQIKDDSDAYFDSISGSSDDTSVTMPDDYSDQRFQSQEQSLNIELLQAQGKEEEALQLQRQAALEQLRADYGDEAEALVTIQEKIWTLEDAAEDTAKALEFENEKRDLTILLLEAQGKEEEALQMKRQIILDQLRDDYGDEAESMVSLQEEIWRLEDVTQALADAESNRNKAADDYMAALREEQAILDDELATAKGKYLDLLQDEKSALKDNASALERSISSLKDWRDNLMTGDDSPLPLSAQRASLSAQLDDLVSKANAGDTDAMAELPGVATSLIDVTKQLSTDWREIEWVTITTAAALAGVEENAAAQLSEAERQIRATEDLIDKVNGVENKIVDLDEARTAYEAAKSAVDNSWYTDEINMLQGILESNQSLESLMAAFNAAQTEVRQTSGLVSDDPLFAGYDPVGSTPTTGSIGPGESDDVSVVDQILSYATQNSDGTYDLAGSHYGWSLENLSKAAAVNQDYFRNKLGFDKGGIATGPLSGYDVELHGTEAVIPLQHGAVPVHLYTPADSYGPDLISEFRGMRQDFSAFWDAFENSGTSIASILNGIRDLLERWDEDGLPRERDEELEEAA